MSHTVNARTRQALVAALGPQREPMRRPPASRPPTSYRDTERAIRTRRASRLVLWEVAR